MKAAKYSEVDQVVESSAQEAPKDILPETVETDFSVVSEVVTDSSLKEANLQAGTSAATSCGPVLSNKCPKDILPETVETDFSGMSEVVTDSSRKKANVQAGTPAATSCGPVLTIKNKEIVSSDGDSVTARDGEEVITNSDDTHDQEGTFGIPEQQEGYDEQIKDEEVGLLSFGSVEGQSPVEASLPRSQEMEAEGSPPKERQEDVNGDHKIEPTGEIDFETGSPSVVLSFTSKQTVQCGSDLCKYTVYFKQAQNQVFPGAKVLSLSV